MRGQDDETLLVCLVPEICFLSGLDDRLRKNYNTMRKLAMHTKVAPMKRHQALMKYIESVNSMITHLLDLSKKKTSFLKITY